MSQFELCSKHRSLRLLILLGVSVVVSACGNGDTRRKTTVDTCVENGIAYYKEIGSYPTLTSADFSGRRAEDVAAEKCSRSQLAFPTKR